MVGVWFCIGMFILECFLGGIGLAIVCLPIHLYVLFKDSDIFHRKEKALQKVRKKVEEKFPDATSRTQELMTRKYLMRKKIITSAIMFLIGLVLMVFAQDFATTEGGMGTVKAFAGLIGGLLVIFGVCKFAAGMHDPLTPQEAKELAEAEKVEKGC